MAVLVVDDSAVVALEVLAVLAAIVGVMMIVALVFVLLGDSFFTGRIGDERWCYSLSHGGAGSFKSSNQIIGVSAGSLCNALNCACVVPRVPRWHI